MQQSLCPADTHDPIIVSEFEKRGKLCTFYFQMQFLFWNCINAALLYTVLIASVFQIQADFEWSGVRVWSFLIRSIKARTIYLCIKHLNTMPVSKSLGEKSMQSMQRQFQQINKIEVVPWTLQLQKDCRMQYSMTLNFVFRAAKNIWLYYESMVHGIWVLPWGFSVCIGNSPIK